MTEPSDVDWEGFLFGDIGEVVRRYRAGEEVVVHFYRDGSEAEANVTLGARPN